MRHFQVGLLGIWLLTSGCAGEVEVPDTERAALAGSVRESLETWRQLKADGGTSYQYTRTQQSWTGSGFRVTVGVKDDLPSTRAYEGFNTDASRSVPGVTETWDESSSELGSHGLDGFDAVRVEVLYARCLDEVLVRHHATHDFTVSFHDDGLLWGCASRPVNCQDDCWDGVSIEEFTFTP